MCAYTTGMNAEFNLNLNNLFYCRRMSGIFSLCLYMCVAFVCIWWLCCELGLVRILVNIWLFMSFFCSLFCLGRPHPSPLNMHTLIYGTMAGRGIQKAFIIDFQCDEIKNVQHTFTKIGAFWGMPYLRIYWLFAYFSEPVFWYSVI